MPTYEYLCNACHGEFETEMRMSDPPQAVCPSCGSSETKRLISHSSFVLKGTGWYVTDYARKNGGSSSGSDPKPSSSPATTPAETKTSDDSKPASGASTPAAAPATTPSPGSAKNSD